VEFALFIAPAPPDLAESCRPTNGFACILKATAFFDTEREATAALSLLEQCPAAQRCLIKELNRPASFDSLLNLGSRFWPERHRYSVDTLWSNFAPAQPLAVARDHFLHAPSPKSLVLCAFSTGTGDNCARLPEAAFSLTAKALLLCYAIWDQPGDDTANATWHRELMAALDPRTRSVNGCFPSSARSVSMGRWLRKGAISAQRCFPPLH
jgi:hypothetical protein